jgi:hypothetical protein
VVFAANLLHRGQTIKNSLEAQKALRRARRSRKTRYRAARFNNRARLKGWLPPSLQSRVDKIFYWQKKLKKFCPITRNVVETACFNIQKLQNPEMRGVEYQQGTLFGFLGTR